MPINPFQSGQQFELQQATNEQALLERQRRERGINALGDLFGEEVLAPTAFATVKGSVRADAKFVADEAQRTLANQRNERADKEFTLQRKILNERAERIFASGEKFRGIVADLNERKFGADQDHIAVLENLAERKFISRENFQKITQELAERRFLSGESQTIVMNAFRERGFGEDVRRFDVGEERAERGFKERVRQFGITGERAERRFREDIRQFGVIGERVERGFEADENQRQITNERNVDQDTLKAEEIERDIQFKIATSAIGFLKAGKASNTPPDETVARLAPALRNLGFTDEQISDLPDQLRSNPNLINELEGALVFSRASTNRRAIGRPIAVRTADNKTALMQTFSDGTTEIVQDVTPLEAELAGRRVDVAEERVKVQALKIDPDRVARVSAGKKGGELTAIRVTDGLSEARDAVIAVENADRNLILLDEGIRTGSLSVIRQEGARFFADILGLEAEQVAETDEFFARSGIEVANQIKAFGSGTGLSDADREFAKAIVGGRQQLDSRAIRRLVKMRRDISLKTIANYNRDRNSFVKGIPRLAATFPNIAVPGAAQITRTRTDIDDLLDKFAPRGGQ